MATRKAAKKKAAKKAPKKKAAKKAGKKVAKKAAKKAGKKQAAKKAGKKKAAKKASSSSVNGATRNAMPKRPKWLPENYHVVNTHLVVDGAVRAIEFYKQAFGAKELSRMPGPDGRLMHAEVMIGDTVLMLADDMPEMTGGPSRAPSKVGVSTATVMIYCEDADALVERARKAGAEVIMPLEDQFWGDRYGKVKDPFGHEWAIATHLRDVSPEEMEAAMAAMSAEMGGGGPPPIPVDDDDDVIEDDDDDGGVGYEGEM